MQIIKEKQTWQVNAQFKYHILNTHLKYLQIKHTTCRGGEHRPVK